jgi:hypothetical protein
MYAVRFATLTKIAPLPSATSHTPKTLSEIASPSKVTVTEVKMQKVIYEDQLEIGFILKLVFIFVFGVIIGPAIWFLHIGETVGALILLIVLILTAVLLFALMPRKYQIFFDRVKVICGLLMVNIPFDDIKSVETRPPSNIYGSFEALRFGTGTGERCVMIKRIHGTNILLQPSDAERFMEMLNNTMKRMIETVE